MWLVLVLIGILLPAVPAQAGEVTDQLKSDIALVLSTLKTPHDGLPLATAGMFDWDEMARRMLGKHWTARTQTEREQFVRLFGGLVQMQIAALGAAARSAPIEYVSESVSEDTATVETLIPSGPGQELRLDYALVRHDGRWLVYDVVVNHASLLGHYRAQFTRILKTGSYEDLITRLTAH